MKPLLPWLLAILSGVLGFLGYIGFDQFYLEWIFLVPLLWAIRGQSPRRSFLLGWLAGTVGHAGGFYWIAHMLMVFAGLNLLFSSIGLALLAAYNGLTFALFAWAMRTIRISKGRHVWWTAPVIWTALENLFPFVFPNYIGASQYRLIPLLQIADITGILGISFWLIACNGVVYHVLASRVDRRPFPVRAVITLGILLSATALYGMVRIHQIDRQAASSPRKKVVMLQAGIGETMKHRDPWTFFRIHKEMTQMPATRQAMQEADLMVWPESVIIVPVNRRLQQLPDELFGDMDIPILFGAITAEKTVHRLEKFTSAMLIDRQNRVTGIYDKRILVPFGEYIPFGESFPVLYKLSPYTSRFTPGSNPAPLPFDNYLLSVNICYEDLFAGIVRENMLAGAESGNPLPHLIVNLTNDSWYGDTIQPKEHLVLAIFRAIEHRRALVRSTNTGISAIVDPAGRIRQHTGQWTREILSGPVPMMSGRTIYSRIGNTFGWLITLLAVILLGASFQADRKTKKRNAKHPRKRR